MEGAFYTHAMWRVHPGQEEAFQAAWAALAEIFAQLPRPPLWGTLIQSDTDPTLFYSFGPWRSREDVAAMRNDPVAQRAFGEIMSLCSEARTGDYRVVQYIPV